MLATQTSWKSGGRILSLALLGGMTFGSASAGLVYAAPTRQHPVQTWLTLDNSWLCRSWSTTSGVSDGAPSSARLRTVPLVVTNTSMNARKGTTSRCTRRWHVDTANRLISDSPNWVANPDGAWPNATQQVPRKMSYAFAVTHKPRPRPRPAAPAPRPQPQYTQQPVHVPAGGYSLFAPVPGHPGYAAADFAGDPWVSYFGVCTWYAWYRHQSEPLMKLGNAAAWAWNASHYGLRTGTTPVVGATVVFQPGVEGAGAGGHVAHVEAVLTNGWFIVSEMNFGVNGGGWGRVDWRYAYAGPGVTFIY